MPENELTSYTLGPARVLMLSILVLYLGFYLNRTITVLRTYFIPPAVSGGLICSAIIWLIYAFANVEVRFDLVIRDLLLLVFFSTIGLSAKFKRLAAGGTALIVLVAAAAVFLVLQNVTGVAMALLFGANPGIGLFAGSISFAGGHGTAIAWGNEATAAGVAGAAEVGIAFATFGLIAGGLVGGPVGRWLISRHDLKPGEDAAAHDGASSADRAGAGELFSILTAIFIITLCVAAGDSVNRFLFDRGVLLPGFLTSMLVGIIITNLAGPLRFPLPAVTMEKAGEVALNIFLAMSLMSMQLWIIAGALGPILIVLMAQMLVITLFGVFIVFRLMGRDYDAAVISSGFVGLGLGATPVAIANMDAITRQYGASFKALLVVPLVGAFFIDILNAVTIKFFIGMIARIFG